jgi:hypothetical protein
MALFHRRDAPPPEVVRGLPAGERVVSWADTASDEVVLATPSGLWWPDGVAHRLIGWQHVDKATWRDGTLTVTEATVVDDLLLVDLPPVSAELSTPRNLPPTVRKRVEANVAHSEVLAITGGTARFVARRVPGRDGLVWWARLEHGTPDAPQVRSAVAARLAMLRAEWEAERAERQGLA